MKLILEIALGYVLGSLLLELARFAVYQIGRLNVRLVMKLLREQAPISAQPTEEKMSGADIVALQDALSKR